MIISSSGIRGIAFRDLSPDVVAKFAMSYAEVMDPDSVVIGTDTRPSSDVLKEATISGLLSMGVKVYDLGISPTPMVFYAIRKLGVDGAIVITGSHNPIEWNALKFADSEGMFIRKEIMDQIVKTYYEGNFKSKVQHCLNKRLRSVHKVNIIDDYINYLIRAVGYFDKINANMRIVIDPAAGSAIKVTAIALKKIGCRTIVVNTDPTNPFRDYEPTSRSLMYLKDLVKGNDLGLAHDSDADRLVLISDDGKILDPDYTLALVIKAFLEDSLLGGIQSNKVVVNIATSQLIKDIVKDYGVEVIYSDIGERNVIDAMIKHNVEVGGEGSCGGVIIRRINPTRDGILAALIIVGYLARKGKKLSRVIQDMPRYVKFHEKIPIKNRKLLNEIMKQMNNSFNSREAIKLGGLKIILDNGNWILFRPSGTEPVLRIIGEARNESELVKLRKYAYDILKKTIEEVEPGATRVFSSYPIREC